jgi:hypothetical protein
MNVSASKPHLIEIGLIAMVIAMLAFVGAVRVTGADENTRQAATRSALEKLTTGANQFRQNTGRFPSALGELFESTSGSPPCLTDKRLVQDGWRRPFKYYVAGSRAKIRSAGPDGAFDTPDDVASY